MSKKDKSNDIENETEKIKKNTKYLDALKNAGKGFLTAAQEERNIRVQFVLVILALILGILFKLSKIEIILTILAMFFVVFAEMINTAIEAIVDLHTDKFHPKAKIAKDVGAGAVILSVLNSVIIAYFVFFEKIATYGLKYLTIWTIANPIVYFAILIIVTLILIIVFELLSKKITKNKFVPSGQAMIASTIFMAIWSQTKNTIIITSALIFVMLVCLNVIGNKKKTIWEVTVGATLGLIIAIIVYTIIKIIGGGL